MPRIRSARRAIDATYRAYRACIASDRHEASAFGRWTELQNAGRDYSQSRGTPVTVTAPRFAAPRRAAPRAVLAQFPGA